MVVYEATTHEDFVKVMKWIASLPVDDHITVFYLFHGTTVEEVETKFNDSYDDVIKRSTFFIFWVEDDKDEIRCVMGFDFAVPEKIVEHWTTIRPPKDMKRKLLSQKYYKELVSWLAVNKAPEYQPIAFEGYSDMWDLESLQKFFGDKLKVLQSYYSEEQQKDVYFIRIDLTGIW